MTIEQRRKKLLAELERDRERDPEIKENYQSMKHTIETASDEEIRKMMTDNDVQQMLDDTIGNADFTNKKN